MARQLCCRMVSIGLAALTVILVVAPPECRADAVDETPVRAIANGGFEEQDDKGRPVGWVFPAVLEKAGYQIRLVTDNVQEGKTCALVDATEIKPSDSTFGNLMQSISATSFRGKRVRFRAAVRADELSADGRAELWFRVDRAADGQRKIGAFDNMQDRLIRDGSDPGTHAARCPHAQTRGREPHHDLGNIQGQPIEVKLRRLRREDFLLVRRGFHWVNEYPFNR